ncbi:MAG: cytochrome d ubiquinol oxidase subunit II [Candidatus Gracilibacteria bacterium]|nr:cytochrome d ubiquinol oxidase subunit II [Candidatus Gracilibacteria bacterium]
MFETLSYLQLQQYWWILVSILGSLLVFLLFVQGGQVLSILLAKNEKERTFILNSVGTKYDLTFTTLVTFGGAFFASFPLFYSTSFGGAFWVWFAILFLFILEGVSFKYRTKAQNFLGTKTFNIFLFLNGLLAPLLLGVAVATFFTGSNFIVNKNNFVDLGGSSMYISSWTSPFHGLEALWNVKQLAFITNISLGLSVLFLSIVLALLYITHTIKSKPLVARARKALIPYTFVFLVFFLTFVGKLLTIDGFAYDPTTMHVSMEAYKYLNNFLEMPIVLGLFLLGVIMVLIGIVAGILGKCKRPFWVSALGTILVVFSLFVVAGFNNTSFYPSLYDLQSSLTIQNASSSIYTLTVMGYVSLLIPFVLAYIIRVWRILNRKPVSSADLNKTFEVY